MKENVTLLAAIIKKRRIRLGYSLRSLGKKVGLSHTQLARFENGNRTNFSLIFIIRLCRELKLDFVNLLTITGYLPVDNKFNEYFENYDDLDECLDEVDDEYEDEEDFEEDEESAEDIIDFDVDVSMNKERNELYFTIRLVNEE